MTLKNGFGKCSSVFVAVVVLLANGRNHQFPTKENPNMEKAFFHWPIVLQYDVIAKYPLISRKFLGHEVFSP